MLRGYFDESGVHDRQSGRPLSLMLGGCIAKANVWKEFSDQWSAELARFKVDVFHMVDFDNHTGTYQYWGDPKGREFLNCLLAVMARNVSHCVCFHVPVMSKERPVRDAYERGIVEIVSYAANAAIHGHLSKLDLTFAEHPEYPGSHITKYGHIMNYGESRIGTCRVADPRVEIPLQAADLIAYEMARMQSRGTGERYPVARLRELGVSFTVG
jgi:hypothetical protein